MTGPIFDYEDGDIIIQTGDNTGFDFDGHMHIKMGNNMSMDTQTGDIHITSSWKNNNSLWDDEDDD